MSVRCIGSLSEKMDGIVTLEEMIRVTMTNRSAMVYPAALGSGARDRPIHIPEPCMAEID
jgi:ATP-dependent 26S proteasome regulatory subunit